MDPRNSSCADVAKLLTRGWYNKADEVVNLNLEEVSKGVFLVSLFRELVIGLVANYIVGEFVVWKCAKLSFAVVLYNIPCHLRCCAEKWR
jgi:hypothetical protein